MNDPISKGTPSGSAWTAAAVLGFALVGALRRPQLTATGGPAADRSATPRRSVAAAQGPSQEAPKAPVAGKATDSGKAGTSGTATKHPPGFLGIARAVFDRFGNDNISLVAAGVAFYVMLSIFPALAALVSLYALVGNPDDVANRIQDYSYLLPPAALKLIIDGLHNFAKTAGSTLTWALGTSVLLALWSARNGISSVMTGLNIAYEEVETRSFVVQTVMALGLTLGAILFAAVAIFAVAIIPIILNFLPYGSVLGPLLDIARWPVLAVFVALGFAVIYRYGPSRENASWRWITWGSGIATVLWLVGSVVFSVYVSKFGSYDATYGALGAVVVLLLWLWVSAIVLLVGAEIDGELDQRASAAGDPLAAVPAGAPRS
ncbi:YihY family inner membrane protein [Lichenibacterium minor]|uniref:YihY family inner membrane protein n=1 Tax=Lichenibacterium minor TaxID=2316528 RepID=A0A4Q2U1E9_9HYPH|nr:YihY/virulence factor BrkB family protein [Lichenibacterium minor]RYC29518.1 YihY family inner membrane protein [Lichenibacterium minor]